MLALVWAGLEAANAAAVGPRGDDWTGFLLAPAGLALLLLGGTVLWRSRRRTGRWFLRRALIALGALAAVVYLVVPAGLALFATHKPRSPVEAADLGRPYEEVTLRTSDGLDLAGWYVPSRNGAAVIVFPGRGGTVPHARMLVRHGYGVLLVDMRGQGESEGDPNAYGWGSTADVDAAVSFLRARPEVEDAGIGGLGLSVGGEQLLEAAAGNEALRAVVSDGAGERSYREDLLRGPRGWLALPLGVVLTTATAVLSGDAPPPALDEVVAGIAPRPILLVQAGRGAGGEDLNRFYHEAAGHPKELWRIPEAGHTGGLQSRPREYERRVVGFLDRALLRD